jgi:hypothetical protein
MKENGCGSLAIARGYGRFPYALILVLKEGKP